MAQPIMAQPVMSHHGCRPQWSPQPACRAAPLTCGEGVIKTIRVAKRQHLLAHTHASGAAERQGLQQLRVSIDFDDHKVPRLVGPHLGNQGQSKGGLGVGSGLYRPSACGRCSGCAGTLQSKWALIEAGDLELRRLASTRAATCYR